MALLLIGLLVGGWIFQGRWQRERRYDALFVEIGGRAGVDPFLLKALAWKESGMDAAKEGALGRRGLLQVGEADAEVWAASRKIESFMVTDVFDPRTNLEVVAFYLGENLRVHAREAEPERWALSAYHAGPKQGGAWRTDAGVRAYVDAVLQRKDHYARHGWQGLPERL